MMKLQRMLLSAAVIAAVSCGPSNAVPTSANHPANPDAPAPAPRQPSSTLDRDMPAPAEDDVLGNAHDTDAHEHGGHEHGGHEHDGDHDMPMTPAEAELMAYETARPVFEEHCAGCHTTAGAGASKKGKAAMKHFVMDSYPFGGHHANELGVTIRKALGVDGGKATMPKDDPGAVQGDQLAAIVAWTHAFDAAHPAKQGDHDHGGHEHGDTKKKTNDDKPDGHDHGGHGH